MSKIIGGLDGLFTSDEERLKAQNEILKIFAEIDNKQHELNVLDSKSNSTFRSGWRPLIGWICAGGIAYITVHPILVWLSTMAGITPPPSIDSESIFGLTMGMLGMASLRTYEKIKK